MKKKIISIISFLFLGLVLTGCTLPFSKKSMAALQVASVPKATVFLNGEHKGMTPFFDESLKPGDYTLKLVPESPDVLLTPWETRIKLTKGVLTVINRAFGLTDDDSAGEILTLEPISDKKSAEVAIISTPDGAVISLDGEPQGFAPLSLPNVSEGDHLITVSLPGYQERKIKAKTVNGYKLAISVQLALEEGAREEAAEAEVEEEATPSGEEVEVEATPTAQPTITPEPTSPAETTPSAEIERPYVEIVSSEIGWVRVRKNPCTSADNPDCEELGKANHGEEYQLLDTNAGGWYQIQYKENVTGWISGRYAEKYE